jgi:hypothetical protein
MDGTVPSRREVRPTRPTQVSQPEVVALGGSGPTQITGSEASQPAEHLCLGWDREKGKELGVILCSEAPLPWRPWNCSTDLVPSWHWLGAEVCSAPKRRPQDRAQKPRIDEIRPQSGNLVLCSALPEPTYMFY